MAALKKPNFLIAGTAKTGTTSIYDYLKNHPQVYLPTKETFFFISELYRDNHLSYPMQRPKEEIVFSLDEFLAPYQKAREEKALGEVATGYLYHYKEAIPLIKKHLGEDVRIVIILRNPVERAFSCYSFFARDLHEKLSFEEALEAEEKRKSENWDFMWHYKGLSLYYDSVRAYLEAFPNVKVMFFEDLKADREGFMKELYKFIGVDDEPNLNISGQKNVSGAPKYRLVQYLVTQDNPLKKLFRPLLRSLFSRERRHQMRAWVKSKNVGEKQRLSEDQYNELLRFFREDVKKLEGLLKRDLSDWYREKTPAEAS